MVVGSFVDGWLGGIDEEYKVVFGKDISEGYLMAKSDMGVEKEESGDEE